MSRGRRGKERKAREQYGTRIRQIVETCAGYPSQWDARTETGHNIYVRYRYGNLSVRISEEAGGNAVQGRTILERRLSDDPLDGIVEWETVAKLLREEGWKVDEPTPLMA